MMKVDFYQGEETKILFEGDGFQYFGNREAAFKYDYNFLNLFEMPTKKEFTTLLNRVETKKFSEAVKIRFPQNQYISPEIWEYAVANDFDFGMMALYFIEPQNFVAKTDNKKVQIETVLDTTIDDYLNLYAEFDLEDGQAYADKNRQLMLAEFESGKMTYYLARIENEPVGLLRIIHFQTYDELDGFQVKKSYQHQGVGTKLQQVALQNSQQQAVVLMADGESDVTEMYEKLGYRNFGFWTEIQKVIK